QRTLLSTMPLGAVCAVVFTRGTGSGLRKQYLQVSAVPLSPVRCYSKVVATDRSLAERVGQRMGGCTSLECDWRERRRTGSSP
ncbi:uncharacterized protein B0H18DRAFT_1002249, partial [Fomitopsis serialis]|uniref:uncharacterized protein n=1 Tax=Fomitopsis serialis TaxID=139415 RepID=UPI00200823DA